MYSYSRFHLSKDSLYLSRKDAAIFQPGRICDKFSEIYIKDNIIKKEFTMDNQFSIKYQKKISFFSEADQQIIELGNTAIEQGFLKAFPGTSLAIFFYLITHLNGDNCLQTNTTLIASYLPAELERTAIEEGLNYLAQHDLIEISPRREGDYRYTISVKVENLSNLAGLAPVNSDGQEDEDNNFKERVKIRQRVIKQTTSGPAEIKKALLSFLPTGSEPRLAGEQIDQWLESFELAVLQELIRRVDKWINKNHAAGEQAFNYLSGIVADWYRKEIFNYKRLQYFDQLYRESRELASAYGIKNWQNLTPSHLEVFKSWLSEDFPLSKSVACFAIQEAIKRKKGACPSLQYIENNFISPWKQARIKSIEQAKAYLKKAAVRPSPVSVTRAKNWNQLNWDFEESTRGVN